MNLLKKSQTRCIFKKEEKYMHTDRLAFIVGIIVLVGFISGPGCATKKFVNTEMAALDKKVEGVETAIEENQKRIREHDERLASIGSIIKQHESQLKGVDSKIEEVKKYAQGKLILKEILRNSEATFTFDSFELSPEAKATLDKFVQTLIDLDRGVYLEIQGHTDSTGPESWNLILGKKRAEGVMDYLYKQHHIPLHRMQVISLGSSVPIADNSSREGRAKNRRVEILVYE
jgi:outer membrane protein OmpA-like peptidoglycan-associated protein